MAKATTAIEPMERGVSDTRLKRKLTPKQYLFVSEVGNDTEFNLTAAAERAGYANPSTAVAKLLSNKIITRAIGHQLRQRMLAVEISAERVLRELMLIAFSDPGNLFNEDGTLLNIADMSEEARRSLGSFEVDVTTTSNGDEDNHKTTLTAKVKTLDKLRALELIGKHLQMWNDNKFQVSHEAGPSLEKALDELEKRRALGHSDIIDSKTIERAANE